MSLLILGGDKINPIVKMLQDLGVEDIIHWTARNQKNSCKKQKKIPQKTDMVLMLTNFLNHNAMLHYREEAKSRGLPIVYSTRNIECVKSEFIKTVTALNSDSAVCKSCEKYQSCYKPYEMLEDFFVIPLDKIDENWIVGDLHYEFFALEYCEEILDIPLHYIDEVDYSLEGLVISLKNVTKELINEDWYVQLKRLSVDDKCDKK